MSACERCWTDAYMRTMSEPGTDQATHYAALVAERAGNPCSPEDQAGPGATECTACGRQTRHQYTGQCMACGYDPPSAPPTPRPPTLPDPAATERAAVVAYLRRRAGDDMDRTMLSEAHTAVQAMADAIERGDHLAADPTDRSQP